MLDKFTLDPYGPALRALGKGNGRYLLAWIRPSSAENAARIMQASLVAAGVEPGSYSVHWWDIERGKALSPQIATVESHKPLRLAIPDSGQGLGLWIERTRRSP
jgi:hypothetical protein